MIPRLLKIRAVKQETHDTTTLELHSNNDRPGFAFRPGTFNMMYVFGTGEVPVSISGDPNQPAKLVHTVRAVGEVTKKLCKMTKGMPVGIRGPFGSSWPVDKAVGKELLLVAGGIGIAPLRPVLYHASTQRSMYGKVTLLYGAQTPEDLLYTDELRRWEERSEIQVAVSVDRGDDRWHGNVGVIPSLIPKIRINPAKTLAMLCGPEVMMRFTIQTLINQGLNKEQIYLSMERNMKCAIGFCGHCQYGSKFICKDGPIFRYDHIEHLFWKREI